VFVLDSAVSIRLVMLAFLLVVFDFDMKDWLRYVDTVLCQHYCRLCLLSLIIQ
jgi:hypothetical protein